jgi:aconitate hydratase
MESVGGTVLANACGPCIGQWKRHDVQKGDKNSIITSFNRNFTSRNDGNPETHAFVSSPETVIGFALTGDLTIDFTKESIDGVHLNPPRGLELPEGGFVPDEHGFVAPAEDGSSLSVAISSESQRLQSLQAFKAPKAEEYHNMPLLLKVKGKCTTDHISMAGPWLRFRGHLDNISNNMLIGAINYANDKANNIKNMFTGDYGEVPAIARDYKSRGASWIVVGEENYGEGSSREHAAMEPRFLGGKIIVVKSFARIHETNLKKQGMLPLTFSNTADYDLFKEGDMISIDITTLMPGKQITMNIVHANGTTDTISLNHSMNEQQIGWFFAGSALNLIAAKS